MSLDIVARLVRWHTAMADEPKRAESKRTKHRETADLIEQQAEELAALRERADMAKAEGIKEGMRMAAEIADQYASVEGIAQRIRDAILKEAGE